MRKKFLHIRFWLLTIFHFLSYSIFFGLEDILDFRCLSQLQKL